MDKPYAQWRRATRSEIHSGRDHFGNMYSVILPTGPGTCACLQWDAKKARWKRWIGKGGCGTKFENLATGLLAQLNQQVLKNADGTYSILDC
jgi:hypothetical protein